MVVEDLNEFIMPRGKANVLACTQIGSHEVVGKYQSQPDQAAQQLQLLKLSRMHLCR